ncbi:protein-tyrosine phosphatase-like protein [Pseudoneurospora amorphoporcata]|uniref:protein-tyrosine-phosphatase n=1 Tax=Pseudoneurospora amorphoporcata TaxID=241081 RepID=A0AAN6NR98_9PEZI|nr:protein-tyrosine phosphatase-like protein [Pseudoneurospora amorphoporcata]
MDTHLLKVHFWIVWRHQIEWNRTSKPFKHFSKSDNTSIAMALNRINGREDLFVGGIFGVNRPRLIEEHKITHILSVINYTLPADPAFRDVQHLSIDIDDVEESDILVHFPKMVRFIERGLYGDEEASVAFGGDAPATTSAKTDDGDAITAAPPTTTTETTSQQRSQPGAVLVHCAMGKSRSVSAIVAYLLWKHPHRFGRSDPSTSARRAVTQAVNWVRQTRPIAEPNDGFMSQLELWWTMGCPTEHDDAVETSPVYQRWLYKREVEDATRIGRAPDWIRFEDEEAAKEGNKEVDGGAAMSLRCKKCRRTLATKPFIVSHQGKGNDERERTKDCGHYFVEALSWMRPTLEQGELEGRLTCPNQKCLASVGRYTWQGFRCSCGDWIAPAFSLQKSKVDEASAAPHPGGRTGPAGGAADMAARMAALGIRMPAGGGRLASGGQAGQGQAGEGTTAAGPKENL